MTHLGKFTEAETEMDAKLHHIWTKACKKAQIENVVKNVLFLHQEALKMKIPAYRSFFIPKLVSCKHLQLW